MIRKPALAFVVAAIALSGCGQGSAAVEEQFGSGEAAESELSTSATAAALRRFLSQVGGEARFVLPESSDFAAIPQDPRNPLTAAKVELGRLLFHEPALLSLPKTKNGASSSSCAACHQARAGFQAGLRQGLGEGGSGFGEAGEGRVPSPGVDPALIDAQPIRSPSAMNGAWQPNQLWNGQFGATHLNVGTEAKWTSGTPKAKNHLGFQGLETQAIAGQDVHRLSVSGIAHLPRYQQLFEEAFPHEPSATRMNQVNAGLAIAAFERTLLANKAPFQRWLKGDSGAMTKAQLTGALLFFGKARCSSCHTGPALNSMAFHVVGMGDSSARTSSGATPPNLITSAAVASPGGTKTCSRSRCHSSTTSATLGSSATAAPSRV